MTDGSELVSHMASLSSGTGIGYAFHILDAKKTIGSLTARAFDFRESSFGVFGGVGERYLSGVGGAWCGSCDLAKE